MTARTGPLPEATQHRQAPCVDLRRAVSSARPNLPKRQEAARILHQSAHGLGLAWPQAIRKSVAQSCGGGRFGGFFQGAQFRRHLDAAFTVARRRSPLVVVGQPSGVGAGNAINRNKASGSAAGLGGGDTVKSVHVSLLWLYEQHTTYLYVCQGGVA